MRPLIARLALAAALPLFAGCATLDVGPESLAPRSETGLASFYARKFDGRRTASGERYDENALTAAHPTFPFGTRLRVTNLANGRSVEVTVNDRGPFAPDRIVDVSRRAARELGFLEAGTARVRVEVISG
jgi:rare lipoprotein A